MLTRLNLSLVIVLIIIFGISFSVVVSNQVKEEQNMLNKEMSYKDLSQKAVIKNDFVPYKPSLAQIFSQNHSFIATLSAEKVRTLIATGDIIPARSVNMRTVGLNNFTWPYEKTRDILRDADVTFVNLESPLINNCPLTNQGMIFCADEKNVEGLIFSGVDVAGLANNHMGNYGFIGIQNTARLLSDNGIMPTGTSWAVIKDVRGLKFAFLGFNDIDRPEQGILWAYESEVKNKINNAKKNSDVVVVAFHWGVEYTPFPTDRQIKLAHLAINQGADLIIGNHPHWIQPVEIYQGKLITYAHGNFVFDQMWSEKTRIGIIGRYIFYEDKLIDVEFVPVKIFDYGQPSLITGDNKQNILFEMRKNSETLQFNLKS